MGMKEDGISYMVEDLERWNARQQRQVMGGNGPRKWWVATKSYSLLGPDAVTWVPCGPAIYLKQF